MKQQQFRSRHLCFVLRYRVRGDGPGVHLIRVLTYKKTYLYLLYFKLQLQGKCLTRLKLRTLTNHIKIPYFILFSVRHRRSRHCVYKLTSRVGMTEGQSNGRGVPRVKGFSNQSH